MAVDSVLTVDQIDTVALVSGIVSAGSICGSGFIIYCYLRFKSLRTFAFRLVFLLSINDFFNQVGDIVTPSGEEILTARSNVAGETSAVCYAQAYMESYFELSSVLWTSAIAATLYMSVFMRMAPPAIEDKFKWMVAVCVGVPLLLTIIPGIAGAYGYAGAWCWILPDYAAWRFIQFYVPLWFAILYNGVVYIMVIRAIKKMLKLQGENKTSSMVTVIGRLRWYPIILVIVWGWATVNRVYEVFTGNTVFWLFIMQKIFSSMQGLLNAIAYGFSANVRATLAEAYPCLDKLACCRSATMEDDDSELQETENPYRKQQDGSDPGIAMTPSGTTEAEADEV